MIDEPVIEEGEEAPPIPPRQLRFLSRQTYPYLGKDVVVMLDLENERPYLIDVSAVNIEGPEVQAVDVSLAISPYAWDQELKRLIPTVEDARMNVLKSFLLAGAFDTSALKNQRICNNMFNIAFPYKHKFFAGE